MVKKIDGGESEVKKDSIVEIKVHTIGFTTTTDYRLECDKFSAFQDDYVDKYKFKDKEIIDFFVSNIYSAQLSTNEKIEAIDTRCIIYTIYQSGKVDSFCMGAFWGMQYYVHNGEIMKLPNMNIANFIDSVQVDDMVKSR